MDAERPAAFRPDDWDALHRRLDEAQPIVLPARGTNWRAVIGWTALTLGVLTLLTCWWRAERALDRQQEKRMVAERQLAERNLEIERLRNELAAVQNPAATPVETVQTEVRYVDRVVEKVVYRMLPPNGTVPATTPNLQGFENLGGFNAAAIDSDSKNLTSSTASLFAKEQPQKITPKGLGTLSLLTADLKPFLTGPNHVKLRQTTSNHIKPHQNRFRPTGVYLNLGAGIGRPEVISSSETISHYAANAGGRLEYGLGDHLQLLAGVDFWKVNYGGLNVRYLPDFLEQDLNAEKNDLQTPRHFFAIQRMQRFSFGMKFLPGVGAARWQPYLAATASVERARTERLIFVVWDDLFRKNRMLRPENYHNQQFGNLAWVSAELRPGVSYQFARRFAANVEGYYALPIDAGAREERFAPRAGLRLGIGMKL